MSFIIKHGQSHIQMSKSAAKQCNYITRAVEEMCAESRQASQESAARYVHTKHHYYYLSPRKNPSMPPPFIIFCSLPHMALFSLV